MAFGKVSIKETDRFRTKEGFSLRQVVGRSVVVYTGSDADFNGIIRLNEEGEFVWKLLDGTRTVSGLADALFEQYDAPREVLLQNVTEVLETLLKENVIERC